MKVRELIKLIETEFSIVYDNQNYNSKSTIPEKVMNDDVKSIHTENDHIIVKINDFIDDESYAMYCDFKAYLPDDILVKVDRAAMAVSLETRAPFLDYRIIEFANALPTHYKIRNGMSKWILKQVLYEYIPSKYFNRPKTGFSVPIDSWLRGPLKDWAWGLINPKRLENEGYLNSAIIHEKWNQHQNGKGNYQYQLWNVLVFQQWLDHQSNL
jgi:asparagine synthase (glutamine-hydrolysing)